MDQQTAALGVLRGRQRSLGCMDPDILVRLRTLGVGDASLVERMRPDRRPITHCFCRCPSQAS